MKTSELTGAALDWAVAKCEGREAAQIKTNGPVHLFRTVGYEVTPYSPSTDWSQGGPIIEREINRIQEVTDGLWEAEAWGLTVEGHTPLVAAMRCYVASKLGDEVEVPEELK